MDNRVIILSANSDVQQFCSSTLSMMCPLSLADSWFGCENLLCSNPVKLLILDFEYLQTREHSFLSMIIDSKRFYRIIILMKNESIFLAVRFIKMGIFDVLSFPCSRDFFLQNVRQALFQEERFSICSDTAISETLFLLEDAECLFKKIAQTDCPVLLLGESGTGKTYNAKKIVDASSRKHKSFISINCCAIPETLAESELFGTEKGAFTGAENTAGKFEHADGGTLFFDEIGELPLSIQAKLLKVIETGTFFKLGSSKETKVDVRFIFATNCDLKSLVAEKKFRFDLYQRICVVQFYLPPLRSQLHKVPLFTKSFLSDTRKTISSEAIDKLKKHSWEGNLRELQNCLLRASILSDTDIIHAEHIIFNSILLTVQ